MDSRLLQMATPQPRHPDGVTTINLWAFEGEEGVFDELIKGFMTDHPNIKVEITDIPEADYTTKIDTALIAGKTPTWVSSMNPSGLRQENLLQWMT